MNAGSLILLAALYLFGGFCGVILRFAMWTKKQTPETGTLALWWRARMGSNLVAIIIGVLGTGLWLDGSLIRWLHLEDAATANALAAPIGAGLTFFGHIIVTWATSYTASKTGAGPDQGD